MLANSGTESLVLSLGDDNPVIPSPQDSRSLSGKSRWTSVAFVFSFVIVNRTNSPNGLPVAFPPCHWICAT